MSANKHTPGPWKMAPQGDAVYAAKGGDIVCLSPSHEGWEDSARRWPGNAHLIAAAPDMLEALEMLVHAADGPPLSDKDRTSAIYDVTELARAAIKKARGES